MVLPSRLRVESGRFTDQTVASEMKRRVGSTWREKPQQRLVRRVKKGKKNTRHSRGPWQEMDGRQMKVSHCSRSCGCV